MIYLVKTMVAAAIIVAATELAKRNSALAALLLALPLVSVITFGWMWIDGQGTDKIADVAATTFWYVLPTLPMFLLLPYGLRHGYNFLTAMAASVVVTVGLFYLTQYILGKYQA